MAAGRRVGLEPGYIIDLIAIPMHGGLEGVETFPELQIMSAAGLNFRPGALRFIL